MPDFVCDREFGRDDFLQTVPYVREYEKCVFRGCDFFAFELKGYRFSECRFINCNMSVVKLDDAVMQEITFEGCKLAGVRFDLCSRFGFSVSFTGCQLDNASFREMKLKKTKFDECRMRETDFSQCDMTLCVFEKCDLERAVFHFTILEKTDFRTAFNYSIDPEVNRLKKARFSLFGLPGLLGKYGIDIEGA